MDYRDEYIQCLKSYIGSLERELCSLRSHVRAHPRYNPYRRPPAAMKPNVAACLPSPSPSEQKLTLSPSAFVLSHESQSTSSQSGQNLVSYQELAVSRLGPTVKLFLDTCDEAAFDKMAAEFVQHRVGSDSPIFGINNKVIVPENMQDDFISWFRTQSRVSCCKPK